jgi:hypothetical protein
MKSFTRVALLGLALTLASLSAAAQGSKPKLSITQYGLNTWGVCAPGKVVFTFLVTVKNTGSVSWPVNPSPGLIVRDLHTGIPPGSVIGAWSGEGYGINPLAPGQSRTYTEHVYYNKHITAYASHPFYAEIGPNASDHSNTFAVTPGPGPVVWHGHRVIMVGTPKGCPQ